MLECRVVNLIVFVYSAVGPTPDPQNAAHESVQGMFRPFGALAISLRHVRKSLPRKLPSLKYTELQGMDGAPWRAGRGALARGSLPHSGVRR